MLAIVVGGYALVTLFYVAVFSALYRMEPKWWGPSATLNAELQEARALARNMEAERQSTMGGSEVGAHLSRW